MLSHLKTLQNGVGNNHILCYQSRNELQRLTPLANDNVAQSFGKQFSKYLHRERPRQSSGKPKGVEA